jgi:hypothetical protein
MSNFLSTSIVILLVMALTLGGGFVVHERIVKNELSFQKYQLYIVCVDQNEKQTCKFILQ